MMELRGNIVLDSIESIGEERVKKRKFFHAFFLANEEIVISYEKIEKCASES